MLIINNSQVRELLPMRDCMEVVGEALSALARGEGEQPLRSGFLLPDRQGVLAWMPGSLAAGQPFGIKVLSVVENPGELGVESHQGGVMTRPTARRWHCARPAPLPRYGLPRYPPWPPIAWHAPIQRSSPFWGREPRRVRISRPCSKSGRFPASRSGAGIRTREVRPGGRACPHRGGSSERHRPADAPPPDPPPRG